MQFLSDNELNKIKMKNENFVYRKIYMKYLMMKIRAKISFMALKKRMTITELFFLTI